MAGGSERRPECLKTEINFCLNYINRCKQVKEIIVYFITGYWQLLAVVEMKSPIRPRVNLSFILEWTIRKENKSEKIQPSSAYYIWRLFYAESKS